MERVWIPCLLGMSLMLGANALAGIPGDSDGDTDVDFADFVFLADCQLGPDNPGDSACQAGAADFDYDTDFDMADVAAFQRCFSGENQPGDPGCASPVAYIENGCLYVIGTAASEQLALRLPFGAPMFLHVDFGNDGVSDVSFDRNLFDCLIIRAGSGDDLVWIDESEGAFTDTETTTILGGNGDDTLLGGSGGELFNGGPGDDTVYAGPGDDTIVWASGEGTEVIEGSTGSDTVEANGSDDPEDFTVTANGTRVRFDRLTPVVSFLDINACEKLVIFGHDGNDTLACTGNLAALIQITADGGAGDDTILGSNGADVLIGGDDDDFVDGQQGNDVAYLGAGDDVFQWDPGDGSDTVEGQAGHDVLVFNGSGASENLDLSVNGSRLRLFRDIGSVTMDADDVEQIDLRALGGADNVTVNSLAGTDVTQANVDLAGTLGGGAGDAQADNVIIAGTPGADTFVVAAEAGFTAVQHLSTAVRVKGYESGDQVVFNGVGGDQVNVNGAAGADTMTLTANGTQGRVDATGFSAAVAVSGALSLVLNGLGGPDSMSCVGNLASLAIPFTLDGGEGGDTILGSNAVDVLIGGDDDDFIDGQQGNDVAYLGAGDDVFQWDPGDGSDTVEGQLGTDALVFNASNAAEIIELSANGSRLRLTRNVGNVVLDADDVEVVNLQALGGADGITVNDMSATNVVNVNIDLAGVLGGSAGDGQADVVTVNGTAAPDIIGLTAVAGAVQLTGLAAAIQIVHSEAALDTLVVNGLGGLDTITTGPGMTALIMVVINQ